MSSIVPRFQLSQIRLWSISLLLPPAMKMPTPTGTGTLGTTSEPTSNELKLFE